MSDVDPRHQLAIDVDALETDPIPGSTPAGAAEFEQAKAAYYEQLIAGSPEQPTCLPHVGVHIYLPQRGAGPCMCKTATKKGAQ